MKPGTAKRLALLTQIADVKAAQAKAAAATNLQILQGLGDQAAELKRQKAKVDPALNAPDTALVATRWLLACEVRMRDLNAKMAIARANNETTQAHARFEEGRRQVISKLKDQAS